MLPREKQAQIITEWDKNGYYAIFKKMTHFLRDFLQQGCFTGFAGLGQLGNSDNSSDLSVHFWVFLCFLVFSEKLLVLLKKETGCFERFAS